MKHVAIAMLAAITFAAAVAVIGDPEVKNGKWNSMEQAKNLLVQPQEDLRYKYLRNRRSGPVMSDGDGGRRGGLGT